MAELLLIISQTVWLSAKNGKKGQLIGLADIYNCLSLAQTPSALTQSPITEQQNTWSHLKGVFACGWLQFWAHTPHSPPQPASQPTASGKHKAVIPLSASETKRRRDAHLHWPDKSVMCHPPPSHLHLSLICLPPPLQSSSHTSTHLIRLCRTDIVCPSCASGEQVAADVLCLCWNPKLTYYPSYSMQN